MKTFRFSIMVLLIGVTMTAVGLYALLHASDEWALVIFPLTLLLLLISLVAIVNSRDERRSFWGGFAIFGWSYFILTTDPMGVSYRSLLPTHAALDTLFETTSQDITVITVSSRKQLERLRETWRVASYSYDPGPGKYTVQVTGTAPNRHFFRRIGHCLWTWLFALIGGFVARHFYFIREREKS